MYVREKVVKNKYDKKVNMETEKIRQDIYYLPLQADILQVYNIGTISGITK